MSTRTVAEIQSYTTVDAGGCWTWGRSLTKAGYAQFHDAGKVVLGHRWMYLRGQSLSAQFARRTSCKAGHPLTPDNLLKSRRGQDRRCKTCARAWNNKYRQARKGQ